MPYITSAKQPWRGAAAGRAQGGRSGNLAAPGQKKKRQVSMLRILKVLVFLALIAFVGLVGYAYLGDLAPERSDVTVPVELNVGK